MALASYQTLTQNLLQAPSSPIPLISAATLTVYINQSRLQVAAQGACVRDYPTLALVANQRQYPFSSVAGLATGIVGIYHIRQLWYGIGNGQKRVTPRPFEWFGLYALNDAVPVPGAPLEWSQFGQGETGNIFVDPLPDTAYTCNLDVLGVPVPLVDESTPEAIPAIWTLAVPYYAAWLGYMSAQRQADADKMMQRFNEQMALARNAANPNLLGENWSQSPDPIGVNRLGVQQARAAG